MSPAAERPRPAASAGAVGASAGDGAPVTHPRKKRISKRSLKVVTAGVAAAGFALPWAVMHAVPKTAAAGTQTVVVPSGAQVTVVKSSTGSATGVVVVTSKGNSVAAGTTTAASAPPAATTHASKPPPPGA
jgi:hypothetical protein